MSEDAERIAVLTEAIKKAVKDLTKAEEFNDEPPHAAEAASVCWHRAKRILEEVL